MYRPLTILRAVLPIGLVAGAIALATPSERMKSQSLTELEQRLEEIDAELDQLAHFSLRSGTGSIGYRSLDYPDAAHTEWIEIDLKRPQRIDQIVLVPCVWRDTRTGFRADAFPQRFRILAGTDEDKEGSFIASYGAHDRLLPRIAPFVVPCETTASWVRVEATALTPQSWDGSYNLQLAEVLVFHGEENITLQKPVTTSTGDKTEGGARSKQFLVDGFLPYLMDAAHGDQSIAFVSVAGTNEQHVLTFDLGAVQLINRVHLHSTDVGDTIPLSTSSDFGVPEHLVAEGATKPDFSDAVRLVEYRKKSIFDAGPIIMRSFPETACRYVRLVAVKPYIFAQEGLVQSRMGFAEVEIFSGERNVARGTPVSSSAELDNPARSLSALTDGRNQYGNILSIREWVNQLARRHDLERERPRVARELSARYARQKTQLRLLGWLAAILAAGIGFTFLFDRIVRMRQLAHIRERFAADLHDELGANLHTIGMLSDLAEESKDSPEDLSMLHQKIRAVTERTGTAVRHCTDMLEASGLYTGLLADMQRAAQRIMAKLEHDISIEGEEFLAELKPRTRVDLFLFYKECLVNISRHSGATRFSTRLTATPQAIDLTITDNGQGVEQVPSSLKRRAHLLRAKVTVDRPPTGGTRISLKLKTDKWKRRGTA